MGSAGIRLETRSPNYVMYLLAIIGDVWLGSSDLPGKGPRVVAINDKGEEIVMEQYESDAPGTRRTSRHGGRATGNGSGRLV